jgi:hypothetical protein
MSQPATEHAGREPAHSTPTRYDIRIGQRSRLILRLFFGVTPDRAWVTLDDERLTARLGWWEIEVPLADIIGWRVEGPWRWITAIGVRRSLRGGDLSFAGSPRGGVRLQLATPVRWYRLSVPALYVGVEDLERLAADLEARGIPGEDVRTG